MVGDELVEEYTFRNQGEDEVVLVDIGVYTPLMIIIPVRVHV